MLVLPNLQDEQLPLLLQDGAVGIVPTDTLYGIAAQATRLEAVAWLYKLKHREHKPGTLIASSVEQLVELGLKARYLHAVEQFWPGPVSVVIPCGLDLAHLHLGKQSLAVRVVQDPVLVALLERTGPLLTSSANPPSQTPAATISQAQAYFAETVDFYVDGGDLSEREPSTVIRVIDDAIEVIRQGVVTIPT